MQAELLKELQPILLALLAGALPGVITWLAGRGKSKADSSQVIVDAAASATKSLIDPLVARVQKLEGELRQVREENAAMQTVITQLRQDKIALQREVDETNSRMAALEIENATLQEKYAQLFLDHHEQLEANQALRLQNAELARATEDLRQRPLGDGQA